MRPAATSVTWSASCACVTGSQRSPDPSRVAGLGPVGARVGEDVVRQGVVEGGGVAGRFSCFMHDAPRSGRWWGEGDELGDRLLDAVGEHPQVGDGVVVTGDAPRQPTGIRRDADGDAQVRAERDVGIHVGHPPPQQVERDLRARGRWSSRC